MKHSTHIYKKNSHVGRLYVYTIIYITQRVPGGLTGRCHIMIVYEKKPFKEVVKQFFLVIFN